MRQITSDRDGIAAYTLSGDGATAWYVSRTGRSVRVDIATTLPTEMLPPTPREPILPYYVQAGSAFSIYSPNPLFNPALAIAIGGQPVPVVSATSWGISAQAP